MTTSYSSARYQGSRIALALALAIFLAGSAAAQKTTQPKGKSAPSTAVAASPVKDEDRLRKRIEAILAEEGAARLHWGIQAVSLASGKVLFERNPRLLFTPASNTKLFTTAAALSLLGPDFRFTTTVEAAAAPDSLGRITGDLVLVGRGDPNLSARVLPWSGKTELQGSHLQSLDRLADQIALRGVRQVDGAVVGDDTYFPHDRYGDGWSADDLTWGYGAPVSALTINDNLMYLEVHPGEKAGDPALVRLDPFENWYQIDQRVTTGPPAEASTSGEPPRGRLSVIREPGSRTLELLGGIPLGAAPLKQAVAMDDPAAFAAHYLWEALRRRGVVIRGNPRARHRRAGEPQVAPEKPPVVLASLESQPALEDYRIINKISQNLHAEIFLRVLGRERLEPSAAEQPGSVAAGVRVIRDFLIRGGVPEDDFSLRDGSGLSRMNLVSPTAVVALLRSMHASPHREAWISTLPIAGEDGTIGERMKEGRAKGNVRAKTGTLSHVAALGGYGSTAKGDTIAISILVNNHNLRGGQVTRLMDRVVEALLE